MLILHSKALYESLKSLNQLKEIYGNIILNKFVANVKIVEIIKIYYWE